MTDHLTLPPEDDRDFTQLTGAFDRPVAPSPSFAERLRQQVAEAQHEQGAPDMHAHAASEPRVSRMTASRVIPMPPARISGGSILEIVAAAVLIFALVSSAFYMYRIQNGTTPTEPEGQRLAATTPLASPTPISGESEAAWTDPGHTNAFPAGFDPATAQPAEPLADLPFSSVYGRVVDDSLVVYGISQDQATTGEPGDTTLAVIDLESGDERWSTPLRISGPFTADENTIYAQEMDISANPVTINLVAYSIETGERLWTYEMQQLDDPDNTGVEIVSPLRPLSFGTPIAIDGNLYVARTTGDVLALDGATGEVLWETAGETDVALEDALGGSLVGDDSHLYVVDGENAIAKLNRETGEIVDRFAVNYRPSPQFVLDLHLQNNRLAMIAQDPIPNQEASNVIDVLDAGSGDILWNASTGPLAGNMVITDTVLGLSVSYPPDSEATPESNPGPNVIRFFNLETGEHLGNVGSSHWRGASASASGPVICLHGTTSEIICYDMDDQESSPYSFDTNAAYQAEGHPSPVLFWNGHAIVLGHEGGPHIIRSGSPTSKATPEPTNATSEHNPARGGAFGTDASLNPTYSEYALPTEPIAPAWKQEVSAPKWMMPYGDVIAVLGTSELAVYDDQTGDELWSQPVSEAFRDELADDPGDPTMILAMHAGPMALPWIESDTLYITTPSELVELDLMTGEETFRTPHRSGDDGFSGSGGKLPSGLAIADGVAYVQSWPDESGQASISAIDLTSGETVWSSSGIAVPHQLAVSGDLVFYLDIRQESPWLVALNATDGSTVWEQPSALSQDISDAASFFVSGDVLVEARTSQSSPDDPSADPAHALRVAAYDADSGVPLWTSRSDDPSWNLEPEAINACGFFPRVSNDALLIPCWTSDMSSMSIVSLPIDGDGTAEAPETLSELPNASGMGFLASNSAWLYGVDDELVHLDLVTGTTTPMGNMGGETCDQRAFPTSNGLACITTDGLGTYYIQVFGPGQPETATPAATP